MRRGRFAEDQIIGERREHEAGVKTTALWRKHGIRDATFYNWKAKYGGTSPSGRRVVWELTAIAGRRGLPCMVVSDNPVPSLSKGGPY